MPPPPGYVITPSDQQPIRSANDTEEFRRNYGANEFVNALYALDSGHTGKGVEVGVIDTGVIDPTGELTGRISSKSKDFGKVTKDGVATRRNVIGDEQSHHGTSVSNIIAAAANGVGGVGYAPDATIVMMRIDDWNADTQTDELWHFNEALDYAGAQKIKLVNASVTSHGAVSEGYALDRYAKATQGLVVISAGNYQGASPEDAPIIDDTNKDSVLFVVALSTGLYDYGLAGYSNQAGTMMDRTVAAPGTNTTTNENGQIASFSGTSSAAPVVTALAADILSKWPQLTGQQSGDIIINTAKDIGDPGVDPVYGHGLVDFKAALAPIEPTLSNGARQTSLAASVMVLPDQMGAGAIQSVLSGVTVLDSYGRDYSGSVAGLVIKPEARPGHWLRRRIAAMGAGNSVSLAVPGFSGSLGFASERIGPADTDVRSVPTAGSVELISDGFGFRAGWNAQESLQTDIMGLAPFADGVLAYAPQAGQSFGVDRYVAGGKLSLTVATGHAYGTRADAVSVGWSHGGTDLRLSYVDEDGSVMGMPTGEGALRLGRGARTAMIEAHQTLDIAVGWSLEGYGSLGVTKLKVDPNSLVTGSTPIIGSRVGLQASKQVAGGVLSLGIAQPLTVESGAAKLTYGTGYDLASRSLAYSTTEASLAGTRRLQLTAGYAAGGPRTSIRIGLMQDMVDRSTRALIGWNARF